MADVTRTIEVIFSAVDRTSGAIDSFDSGVNKLTGTVGKVTGPLADLTKKALATQAAIAAMAVAFGTAAFNAASKFQISLTELEKQFTGSKAELDAYADSLGQLAFKYGQSTGIVLEAAAGYLQAGKSTEEALKLTALSFEQAEAAGGGYEAAVQAIKVLSETYGDSADSLRLKLDFLNTVSDNSAVSTIQLLDAIQRSAGASDLAGLSFEQLVAVLTPMLARTQEFGEAGNALKLVLSNLQKPTKDQAQVMSDLGVSFGIVEGEAVSAGETFFQIIERLSEMDKNAQGVALATLAGAEQINRLSGAVTGSSETQKILNGEFAKSITLLDEFNRKADDSDFFIRQLNQQFGALLVTFGQEYQSNVDGVTQAVTRLVAEFSNLIDAGAFDEFFELAKNALDLLDDRINRLADNLPAAIDGVDFTRLINAIRDLGGAFSDLVDSDLTSVDGLSAILQTIADGLATLTEFSAGAVRGLEPFIDKVLEVADTVIDAGPEIANLAGNIGGLATGVNALLPILTSATGVVAAFAGLSGIGSIARNGPIALAALDKLGGGVTNLITKFAGTGGLVAAAGLAGAAVGNQFYKAVDSNETFLNSSESIFRFADGLLGVERNSQAAVDGVRSIEEPVTRASLGLDAAADAADSAGSAISGATDSSSELASNLDTIANSSQDVVRQLESISGSMISAAFSTGAYTDSLEDQHLKSAILQTEFAELSGRITESIDRFTDYKDALDLSSGAISESTNFVELQSQAFSDGSEVLEGIIKTVGEDGVVAYTDLATAQSRSAVLLGEYVSAADVAKNKTGELSDAIKTASIEAKVKLDIADVESKAAIAKAQIAAFSDITVARLELDAAKFIAETKLAQAAIEGIATTVESSGEVISSALSQIGDFADLSGRLDFNEPFQLLTRQIEIENAIRKQAIEDQQRLNDAIIRNLEAKSKALARGDALIKIDGTGLEPELNAFMFKIVENVQIKAAEEYADFLLGLNVGAA